MRIHRMLLASLAVGMMSLAACGSAAPAGPAASTVQSTVETALGVKLTAQDIPADAKSQGVVAYLGNNATAATDMQIVQVFVLDSESKVAAAKDALAGSASSLGSAVKVITHKTIMVIYAAIPGGTDNGAKLESAINAL